MMSWHSLEVNDFLCPCQEPFHPDRGLGDIALPVRPPLKNQVGRTPYAPTPPPSPSNVTRIIIPFEGYPGRYVRHSHILEHEDNEMMRPFEVVAEGPK